MPHLGFAEVMLIFLRVFVAGVDLNGKIGFRVDQFDEDWEFGEFLAKLPFIEVGRDVPEVFAPIGSGIDQTKAIWMKG